MLLQYNHKRRLNFQMKAYPKHHEGLIRQSDHILDQIGHTKQYASPYLSNTNLSQGQKQKWSKYLPNQNNNANQNGSLQREQNRNDNYLQSLERRLQKLFKEQKDMLKERHYKNDQNQSSFEPINKRSLVNNQFNVQKDFGSSYNVQNMDRKIRELEQRYRKRDCQKKQKQFQGADEDIRGSVRKVTAKDNSIERRSKNNNEKINYQYSPTYNQNLLTQSVQQCINKERYLEDEVQSLKKSVQELHQNNKSLLKRIQKKNEKKKHKHRTKQLLQNILHKLEFINVEIRSAKKSQFKNSDGKIGKIQKDTQQIIGQFQLLRLQYKHLQSQKEKFEKRQRQMEKKIQQITQPKSQKKI